MTAFRVFRDVLTFLGGLALAAYEVIGSGEPSLVVLGLAATMMGLPGTLGVDRLLNRGDSEPGSATSTPGQVSSDEPPEPPTRRRHGR